MAWAGKASGKQKTMLSIKSRLHPHPMPRRENPLGVPRAVMKALQWQQLPFDKTAYERGLRELLIAYELNGG
jgi:hypothetical protein